MKCPICEAEVLWETTTSETALFGIFLFERVPDVNAVTVSEFGQITGTAESVAVVRTHVCPTSPEVEPTFEDLRLEWWIEAKRRSLPRACPECGAGKDEPCINLRDKVSINDWPHKERVRLSVTQDFLDYGTEKGYFGRFVR